MAGSPTIPMEAGSHERAGGIGMRIQYGGHVAALDGEGHRVTIPERPLSKMAQEFNMQSLAFIP